MVRIQKDCTKLRICFQKLCQAFYTGEDVRGLTMKRLTRDVPYEGRNGDNIVKLHI